MQGQRDLVFAVMPTLVPQFGQLDRVVLAIEDGVDDEHPGQPRDVTNDFGQSQDRLIDRVRIRQGRFIHAG